MNTFLWAQIVVCIVFGILLFFAPALTVSAYVITNLEGNGAIETISRVYGAVLLGLGFLGHRIRTEESVSAKRSYVMATTIANLLVTGVHIRAIMQGVENETGWATAILTAGLTVWGGILLLRGE